MGEILFWIVMCPNCDAHIEEDVELNKEGQMVCQACGELEVPAVGVTRAYFTRFSKDGMAKLHRAAAAMLEVR